MSTPNDFSDKDKWQIDQIIMRWWDAKDVQDKRRIELECYKELKALDFSPDLINYLRDNEAESLADEMEHFMQIYQKVSHDHEKRKVA